MVVTTPKPASPRMSPDPSMALQLSPTFQPHIDLLLAEGVSVFGIKGAGKSNVAALLAEQIGRYHVPQVIFDSEGEYTSLINLLPHGVLGTAHKLPSGYDILHKGLQVVIDLQSWDTDEAAAFVMCQLLDELLVAARQLAYQDRTPCVVHLDEASHWLSQIPVGYLSKEAHKLLIDTFHTFVTRGRKLGLVMFSYTQRISEIAKSTISQAGIHILMRQASDVDVKRYCEYLAGNTATIKKAVRAFCVGKAAVVLPGGVQFTTTFHQRASSHPSHTPKAQIAVSKFSSAANLPPPPIVAPTRKKRRASTRQASASAVILSPIPEIAALLEQDPGLSPLELMERVGCSLEVAKQSRANFFNPPIEASTRSRRASRKPASQKSSLA